MIDWVLEAVHEAGDHYLVTGRVAGLGATRAGRPLLFYRGRYAATDPGTGPTEVVDTLLAWPHHSDWMLARARRGEGGEARPGIQHSTPSVC